MKRVSIELYFYPINTGGWFVVTPQHRGTVLLCDPLVCFLVLCMLFFFPGPSQYAPLTSDALATLSMAIM
jgi:hypothetical protein